MGGLTFLLVFLILMTLVAVVPLMLRRWHIPAVVAIMLVGIAIGPNAIVCLSVVTTIPVPTLVKLLIVKGGITFDQVDERVAGLVDDDVDDDTL